jgi:hypothetical protein
VLIAHASRNLRLGTVVNPEVCVCSCVMLNEREASALGLSERSQKRKADCSSLRFSE